jgi:oligopeptide transport system substrate-binding protein
MLSKVPALLLSLLLVVACGCKQKPSPTAKIENKDSLKLYVQTEPLSLDPRIGGNRASQVIIRELFEPLMRINKNGAVVPAQAEKVDISSDCCTYTFTLRDNHWTNGDKVTAHDFEYAWKSILSPDFPTSYPYAFYLIKGARKAKKGEIPLDKVGIKALDDKTLVVQLTHPAPYFLELTANALYSPVCKKIVETDSDWSRNAGPHFVTNGPFAITCWMHQVEIQLTKSTHYKDANQVKLNQISFTIIEEPQTALNLFEKQELDWVGEPLGTIPLEAVPSLKNKLISSDVQGLYWYEINTKNELLKSSKIRKALAIAIDRKELTKHLLQGGEKPAFSIIPNPLTHLEKPICGEYNVKRAQELFQEGLNELNISSKTLPTLTIIHWADPREKALAQAIQQEWSKAFHLPVKLISCDWNTFFTKINSSDYQIAGSSWYSWYQDPTYNLDFMKYTENGLNGTNWHNDEYTKLLDEADHELNKRIRAELLTRAEELIMDEMPIIPIYSQSCKFMQNPHLKGTYITPAGMLELKDAYLD